VSNTFANDSGQDEFFEVEIGVGVLRAALTADRAFVREIALLAREQELVSARRTGVRMGKQYAQKKPRPQTPVRRVF
jgi:hypothetical protein